MRKAAIHGKSHTETTVALVGNSLAVRIPRQVAQRAGLKQGSPVRLLASGSKIVIERAEVAALTLNKLLQDATPQNSGGEVDWGDARGHEAW